MLTRKKVLYRIEQVLIIVAHILLLKWILFALYEGGTLTSVQLLLHFVGMAFYGAFLIRFCAWLAKRRFLKNGGKMLDAQNKQDAAKLS